MTDFEAFILTGGASRRMERDKSNLKLADKTFVEIIASEIEKLTPEKISIVGQKVESKRLPVVADVFTSEKRGAIIGLHSALFRARADWILTVACDLPFVTGELFRRLASFRDEKTEAIVPIQTDGRAQPLCAFYRTSCLPFAEEALRSDDWSLRRFLEKSNVRYVEFAELADLENSNQFFLNINTPEDFRAAQKAFETNGRK